jgi:hypothetical protein
MLIHNKTYVSDSIFDVEYDMDEILEDEHLEFDDNGMLIGELKITVEYVK